MITKETYEYYQQFRAVINLFVQTGEYVGGCDALFNYMKVEDLRCAGCVGSALITANSQMLDYERNLSSVSTPRKRRNN